MEANWADYGGVGISNFTFIVEPVAYQFEALSSYKFHVSVIDTKFQVWSKTEDQAAVGPVDSVARNVIDHTQNVVNAETWRYPAILTLKSRTGWPVEVHSNL